MPELDQILSELIGLSQTRTWPRFTARQIHWPWLDGKVDALIGMRRVGKSTCCIQQMHTLEKSGVARDRMLYLNFEDERLSAMTTADLRRIPDVFYRDKPELRQQQCIFFFDEIQNVPGWEKFVRRLLDQENVHICVTGSSAKMLSAEIATSLRGRALATEVFPFSFREYLLHHEVSPVTTRTSPAQRSRLEKSLTDYLEKGGFPEVQNVDEALRISILQEYLDVVLLRDVIERHEVANPTALRRFVRQLMSAPASLMSVHRIHNDLRSQGVSVGKDGLHTFLDYLGDAFFLYTLEVYTRSERVRQSNPRKLYLIDPGMITACTNNKSRGALLENFVFMELRRLRLPLFYVKTANGHEVDFLYETGGAKQLVQVCAEIADKATRTRELRALTEAMREHKVDEAVVVTLFHDETLNTDDGTITMIPAWRWALTLASFEKN